MPNAPRLDELHRSVQWPAPPVPAHRHRPTCPRRRQPRRYRDQAEHPTTQDSGLENLHGGLRTDNMIHVIVATIARIRPRTQAATEGQYSRGSDIECPSTDFHYSSVSSIWMININEGLVIQPPPEIFTEQLCDEAILSGDGRRRMR